MTKHLLHKTTRIFLLLVLILCLKVPQAQAICWSIFGGGPTGNICNFACWCDGYDQDLGEMPASYSPNSLQKLPLTDSCPTNGTSDPVDFSNGQFYYNCQDLTVPGRELDLSTTHTYNSGSAFNGPFGYGWVMNFYMRLHWLRSGNAVIVAGNGRKLEYTLNGSIYQPPAGRFETLVKNPDLSWTLTEAHGDTYTFDPNGLLIAVKDRNNNAISLTYSTTQQPIYGRSEFAQDPLASIVVGTDYRLIKITDTTGRMVNLNYNTNGRLSTIVDGTRTFTFNYDSATGDLLSITKPATTQFPNGVIESFLYDSTHNLTKMTDAKSQNYVENIYDTQGRVQEQKLAGASIYFNYSVPNVTTETDRNGNVSSFTFDINGLLTKKETFTRGLRTGEPVSFVTNYAYNSDFLKIAETLPKGNGATYTYDSVNASARSHGNLLRLRRKTDMAQADDDINNIVTNFTYDPQFNLLKNLTDPKGNVTAYTYDYELNHLDPRYGTGGNVVTITYPMVDGVTPIAEFAYNQYGQVTEAADPNNIHTLYEYFPATGYLKKITQDPTGINAQTQFTYDTFGYLDTVTDANNHMTNLDYDALGWLTKTTDALGQETLYTYDANGNLIKSERKSDYRYPYPAKTFTYTVRNKIQTAADEVGNTTTFGYDADENLASMTDANNKATNYQYDERNLLWKVMDANTPAGATENAYDLNGNLAQIKDANLNATNYLFDLFDRQQKMTYADNNFSQYAYDKNSNLTQHLTPSNAPINYGYDELNRLTTKTYTQTPSLNVTYGYDVGSRLTAVSNQLSAVSYQYDNLNRVSTTTQILNSLNPLTLSYQYDKLGNRTKLTHPDSTVYNYTYDAVNRPDLIKDASLNTLVDYDYNGENRMRSVRKYGSKLTATYNYDYAQRLTSVVNSYYDHTVYPPNPKVAPAADSISQIFRQRFWNYLDRFFGVGEASATNQPTGPYDVWNTRSKSVYTLDAVGNRLTNTTNAGLNTYTYNNIYELTSHQGPATSHQYAYDKVGNRTTADGSSYTSNALNQYDHVGSNIFNYDINGNLTDDGPGGYTYDVENRLVSAQNVSHNSSYAYDGLGRRISKTVDGSTTYFVYDGDQIIEERASNGTLLASYLYGEGIDEILMMRRGTTNYWYLQDGLSSVTDVVDLTGKTLYERYEYDPYGKPTIYNGSNQIIASSAISNPFMFTGRWFDAESGLYDNRARTNHPGIGRFTQRDPIDYADGMNLYTYAHNSPVNYTDPLGLWYIDINASWGWMGTVGTGGIIFSDQGIYTYSGGGGGTWGPGGGITWSPNNPTVGWNEGFQVGTPIWLGGQWGQVEYQSGKKDYFKEYGLVIPGVSVAAYYVKPFKWPWEKDKNQPCSEEKK